MRRILTALLLTMFAALFALPAPAGAVPSLPPIAPDARTRCFPETGHCVSDPILRYWEQNGGVAVFGYPISMLAYFNVEDTVVPAQWFERDRLEDHSASGKGVLAGRLGANLLALQGRPWESFTTVNSAPAGCRYFAQTKHSLCQPFLSYWERNGGLDRFGYPITEAFVETVGGWTGTVQYFERRRMEHHTELAGTPHEILLGLLGRSVFDWIYGPGPSPAPAPAPLPAPGPGCTYNVVAELRRTYERSSLRDALGCPTKAFYDRPAALQGFENGLMLWTDLDGFDRRISAALTSIPAHRQFVDTWREGEPAQTGYVPPPGLYAPERGFGKVWANDAELRRDIGWARTPEQGYTATIQQFEGGTMIWFPATETVYIFGPNYGDLEIIISRY